MNNSDLKKRKSGLILGIVLLSFVSLAIIAFGVLNLLVHADYYFGTPKAIEDMVADGGQPQKGEYVQVGVDVCFDWYAETTHKVNGIPTGKEKHCIIMLENGDIMSLTVKGKKKYKVIDEIIDDTWNYMYDETGKSTLHTPVIFEGKITNVGSEVSKYYREYMNDLSDGFQNAWGYRPNYYELTIDTTDNKMSTLFWYIGGALMVALFVFGAISCMKSLKAIKTAEKAGYDSSAYMQNRQNDPSGSDIYGNDIAGYTNNTEKIFINDIVSNKHDNNNGEI